MAMTHTPTDEQQQVIDAVAEGGDVVIEAGAGTGKSMTLRLVGESERWRPGMLLAFGREVAEQARTRFPPNVACSTGHSLAYRAVVPGIYDGKTNADIVTAKDLAERLGIRQWFKVTGAGRKDLSSWRIASLARETVARYCRSDDDEIKPWHVPFMQGVANQDELRATVVPYAQRLWAEVVQIDGGLPFRAIGGRGDDAYMKIWALTHPRLMTEYVMVDESQDTNPVLAGVLREQTHLQRVFVGDSRQRLFDWRGSTDIMAEFSEDSTVCYLTQSFRFGDAVAEEANRWLSYLDAPLRLRGLPSIQSELRPVEMPDAILCRTNADVIEQAMRAQGEGVPVAIVGGTDEISSLADAVQKLQLGERTSHSELSVFKTWSDVLTYVQQERPGGTFGTMMRLIERYGARRVIEVAGRCVPPQQAERVVATVHKVKGLEWPSVAVDGDVAPSNDGDPSDSDYMVAYVAVTRAKEALDTTAIEFFHRFRELSRSAR